MKKVLLIIFLLLSARYLSATEITIDGQISIWSTYYKEVSAGARYIPELRLSHPLTESRSIDCDTSLNMYTHVNDDIKFYRAWMRYSSPQFELRFGLQKINFGPAKILRSLMWFDRVDPRDPLQLTDGVTGILGRYYFLNNANIWVWGLYGNSGLKGLEVYKTDKNKMELGTRFQYPVPRGEIAFTFNERHVNSRDWNRNESVSMSDGLEFRYGLDGIWDIGPGMWFEAAAGEIKINTDESHWQSFLTLGTDYTLGIGSGIRLLYEHFIKSSGSRFDNQGNAAALSAFSTDFNISMVESLNTILYYDWNEEKIYLYTGLNQTYDNWIMNLGVFSSSKDEEGIFAGNGVLCMITYNHKTMTLIQKEE